MSDLSKERGPSRPFIHGENCKVVNADPSFEVQWQLVERGHWVATCVCGVEHLREEPADRRVRLDPLDPSSFRHATTCEHRAATDPTLLRVILKVRDGTGGDYWWVECGACDTAWPVPHYAAESVG